MRERVYCFKFISLHEISKSQMGFSENAVVDDIDVTADDELVLLLCVVVKVISGTKMLVVVDSSVMVDS